MPYIFVDEIEEGQTEADVVERDLYDTAVGNQQSLTEERDSLLEKVEMFQVENEKLTSSNGELSAELQEAKTKFANAVLSAPFQQKHEKKEENDTIQSYDGLFGGR